MIGESFENVLAAACDGAAWAWERIYDEMTPVLLGYLRARGARDPDDLVGEVYLQLVQSLPTFEGSEDGFRAWVFTIAYHRLIDDSRYRGRRPEIPTDTSVLIEPSPDDVETQAAGHLELGRIREALDHLTPPQADVLLLRIIGGFSVAEVAAITGRGEGGVKSLQHRGLRTLERLFADGRILLGTGDA